MSGLRVPVQRHNWHDAFDCQMAMWRWYRGEVGRGWLVQSWRDNVRDLSEDTADMLAILYANEVGRLIDCDPIYVQSDFCDLIDHARHDFKPEPLMEMDLITPRGFLFYETPFIIPDRFDKPTTIKAISWTRVFNQKGDQTEIDKMKSAARLQGMEVETTIEGVGTHITSHESAAASEEFLTAHGAEAYGIALTLYSDTDAEIRVREVSEMFNRVGRGQFPPVVPLHLTPWYFGMTFQGNEWDEVGKPTGAEWWWRIVQTTFRLMLQRIGHKTIQRPDRAARREAARLKMPAETEVVVVTLRREESERKEPSGEKANYSHRFLRSGHWRNQPYKGGVHRQIWIDPTIVGDESLPLVIRPRRVFQWRR